MKRFLSVLLVTILMAGLMPGSILAETNPTSGDGLIAIREINVEGFRAPVAGSTPEHSYFLSVNESLGYFIVYQYWHNNTLNADMTVEQTPFEATDLYSAGCVICPCDGYYIAEDCVYKINGSTKLVDLEQTYPHPYLEGDWIVQSIGVACAEEEAKPTVTLSPASFTYDGTRKKPNVTVKVGNTVLQKNRDYTVAYTDNLNAGTAKAIITLKGRYSGTAVKTFRIYKAEQKIKVTKKNQTVKYSEVQRRAQVLSGVITVPGAQGKVIYAKESGSEYLTIAKQTGKITVRKGTPKGSYEISVKVTAKATANYKKATKTVTVKIRVK